MRQARRELLERVAGLFLPGDLHEEITLTKVIAAALIIAGIYLVTRERPARR